MDKISKALKRFNTSERHLIAKILNLLEAGDGNLDIKRLKKLNNIYRVRKGQIRIIYSLKDGKISLVEVTKDTTALVIIDPQNDFLSPEGVTWGLVGDSVKANNTVR